MEATVAPTAQVGNAFAVEAVKEPAKEGQLVGKKVSVITERDQRLQRQSDDDRFIGVSALLGLVALVSLLYIGSKWLLSGHAMTNAFVCKAIVGAGLGTGLVVLAGVGLLMLTATNFDGR